MTDQKIKSASDKVPLDLIPLAALKGPSRVYGYGARKYAAGNYYTAADDQIVQRYIGATLRHISACQNPNGLFDMQSVAAIDIESGLPEIDHAICGLLMLRALVTKHGALPADPGVGHDPHDQESLLARIRVRDGAFDVIEPNYAGSAELKKGDRVEVALNMDSRANITGTYQCRATGLAKHTIKCDDGTIKDFLFGQLIKIAPPKVHEAWVPVVGMTVRHRLSKRTGVLRYTYSDGDDAAVLFDNDDVAVLVKLQNLERITP